MSGLETLIELFYLLAVQDTQHDVARAGTRLLETLDNTTALPRSNRDTPRWNGGVRRRQPGAARHRRAHAQRDGKCADPSDVFGTTGDPAALRQVVPPCV
jgi:hypothetical protein